ncbi:hypothetical protein ACQY0O_005164 [Thecaphora frezii]
MSSPGGYHSFASPHREPNYQPLPGPSHHDNRSVSPSSAKNKFWPFNRSRSASPNDQATPRKGRATSPNPSTGFVVRTVTRQPGGVSAPASPVSDAPYQPEWTRVTQQSPRRMKLEDSDDDDDANGRHQLQYKRSKSRPIASALSLSVPAGGPGGGVGYGTAKSSNDGRPEPLYSPPQPASPRPGSPGGASMTAGGFQKSLQERGRSPRKPPPSSQEFDAPKSPLAERSRSRSAHSAQSSEVVTPSGKVVRPMVTPGPKSLAQLSSGSDEVASGRPSLSTKTSFQSMRPPGISGPRQFPGVARPSLDGGAPRPPHEAPHRYQRQPSPLGFSPSSAADAATLATSPVHAQGTSSPMHGPASQSQSQKTAMAATAGNGDVDGSCDPGSQSRGRRFSFGFARGRKASDAAAAGSAAPTTRSGGPNLAAAGAAAPLDGLPSPVDIPYGRQPGSGFGTRSRSRDPGAETDYSYENGASPFGSVSPAGSPGFLASAMAARGGDGNGAGDGHSASPAGSGLAGKWFKGIFGRSPRADEGDQDWRGAPIYPDAEAAPGSGVSSPQIHLAPNQARRSQTLPNPPSEDDVEALLQKRQSMKQARRIVDAERRELMAAGPQKKSFDPDRDREFRPRQAVNVSEDYEANFEAQRRKSPPGRKPAPRLGGGIPGDADSDDDDDGGGVTDSDGLGRLEGRLTPAQKIIRQTRSMHLAQEELENQRGSPRSNNTAGPAARDRSGGGSSSGGSGNSRASDAVRTSGQGAPQPPSTQEQPEKAVRRGAAGSSGKGKGKARALSPSADVPTAVPPASSSAYPATPSQQRRQVQQPHKKPATASASGAGGALSPGSGPMPLDMTLPQALQEMMIRFYRFERYSVPLIRSLETRLLDIERDAMMAYNPQSGARGNVETASQHEEMDRWVGQMTMLMKHEVGQLRAAAKEIREGRELVARVAKGLAGSMDAGIGGSSLPTFSSVGTLPSGSNATPPRAIHVEDKGVTDSPSSTKGDTGIQPPAAASPTAARTLDPAASASRELARAGGSEAARKTNLSSSTFRSAVPTRAASNLALPPGAKPALDKDEGKYGSPTKSTFDFGENGAEGRERSVSPSGRPRYTSALGQPMQNGRLSPGAASPVRHYPDAEVRENITSPGRWAEDQRRFGQALVASPAVSDQASIHSGISSRSGVERPRREMSVEERLKALLDGKSIRSRASSYAGSLAEEAAREVDEEGDHDAEVAREASDAKIGDDYSPAPEGEIVEPDAAEEAAEAGAVQQPEQPEPQDNGAAAEDGSQDRRWQNASQSTTTTTTSAGAHTIRPGTASGIGSRAPASTETPTRPLSVQRRPGEVAKQVSAFGGATPLKADGDASLIAFPGIRGSEDPSSGPGARRASRKLSLPATTAAEAGSGKVSPNSGSVRERALSYLSTAGASSPSDEAASTAPAATASWRRSRGEEEETAAATPSKTMTPGSWLASGSPGKAWTPAAAGSASGRISPSKLHANRFASPDKEPRGSSGSPLPSPSKKVVGLPLTSGAASNVVAAKWGGSKREGSSSSSCTARTAMGGVPGLSIEKKRSFGATSSPAPGPGSAGASKGPVMVGHAATLKERVAFFDSVK